MEEREIERLYRDMDLAKNGQGDFRAMRVTLECGHFRLMARINTIQGIGAQTSCFVCPSDGTYTYEGEERTKQPSRLVVNVEETGTLSKEYHQRVTEGLRV